jgi:hypothetical protein
MIDQLNQDAPDRIGLDVAIAGLNFRSEDRDVRSVLKRLFLEALPPGDHERQADRIRRVTHMNRGTFRRLMRYAQEDAQQRTSRA